MLDLFLGQLEKLVTQVVDKDKPHGDSFSTAWIAVLLVFINHRVSPVPVSV